MRHLKAALFLVVAGTAGAQGATRTYDFSKDQVGKEPAQFLPMVGNWVVTQDGGRNVLMVDGRIWRKGQPAGGLADKARAIYGAQHEEFLDNVKQFAYFPIAVNREIEKFEDGDISVKFKMIGGTLDRCSGILFNVKPNGDWLAVRFNGTEDNVVLWKFVNGQRSSVKRGTTAVPLELGTWNELKVSVKGANIKAYLNGQLMIDQDWTEAISGKVGLWSKTDSMSEFDAFTVTPRAR
jgi:hypothetical protein